MDNVLGFIGLLKNAGLIAIGDDAVGAAVRGGRARLVLVSMDAADNAKRRAANYTRSHGVANRQIPCTKTQTGAALGRDTCAILAVCDKRSAAALIKKLETGRGDHI